MNRFRSFLAGLAFGIAGLGVAFALPITGPLDLAGLRTDLNAQVMKWMSFPDAEVGELQLLGARSFTTAGSKRYVVFVDPSGTPRYALVIDTASP